MNSRERILAACNGQPPDHVPLTTWCFGFQPPPHLRWQRNGREVRFWYSKRLEHIHTLPQPWELEDDFQRVLAWRSHDPGVRHQLIEPGVWRSPTYPLGGAAGDPCAQPHPPFHPAPKAKLYLFRQDALFPDTPWSGVEAMIEAWQETR